MGCRSGCRSPPTRPGGGEAQPRRHASSGSTSAAKDARVTRAASSRRACLASAEPHRPAPDSGRAWTSRKRAHRPDARRRSRSLPSRSRRPRSRFPTPRAASPPDRRRSEVPLRGRSTRCERDGCRSRAHRRTARMAVATMADLDELASRCPRRRRRSPRTAAVVPRAREDVLLPLEAAARRGRPENRGADGRRAHVPSRRARREGASPRRRACVDHDSALPRPPGGLVRIPISRASTATSCATSWRSPG